MSFELSIGVLVTVLCVFICINDSEGNSTSYGVGGNSYNIGNTINLRNDPEDCQDFTGRKIHHGSHYVPAGLDMCKMCICENGISKSCRAILCKPPSDCKSFQMSSSCCEFICLDKKDHEKTSFSTRRVITLILGSILLLVIILCCICRFQYIKKEVQKRMKKMKSKRNQQTMEEVPSNIAFSEDLYVTMSVDMITKNDEIDTLKRQISVLEDQLDNGIEEHSNASSLRNSQHILTKNDESWKSLYVLQVDIKESAN